MSQRRTTTTRSESPPLRKTRRAHLPSIPTSTLADAIEQVVEKDRKAEAVHGRTINREAAKRHATRYVVREVYGNAMAQLRREFETTNGRLPRGAEVQRLARTAERLALQEIDDDMANESALRHGAGHSTVRTAQPRTRGTRFEIEEAVALANEPPPPPRADIVDLIQDFMAAPTPPTEGDT